jgi:DNA repair protein RadC
MKITDWPLEDRPREKLLRLGSAALTDTELLALFYRVGIPGHSAVDLARESLAAFDNNLSQLLQASEADFCQIKGLGQAKYVQLQACLELARRTLQSAAPKQLTGNPMQAMKDLLRLRLMHLKVEVFYVVYLDAQLTRLGEGEVSRGTINHTAVHPREILKQALALNASFVILAHNHPTGEIKPSPADIDLTRLLEATFRAVEIRILDHFIVGPGGVYSFHQHGMLI